jgi:predicted nucleic-acid-binding protein
MISLDTNVMVRIFVDDPQCPEQNSKARQIVSKYEMVYVTQIVQVETVWVLSRAYGFSRADIDRVLESMLNNAAFRLENETIFSAALQLHSSSNIDFADALILQNSIQQNLNLLSFDRKLQKQQGVVSV